MTLHMGVDDDEDLDDKCDLCVSAASRSDVISRSGRLFAPPGKAADAVSNKYPIKICLQFILTCTALSGNCQLILVPKFQNHGCNATGLILPGLTMSPQLFGP